MKDLIVILDPGHGIDTPGKRSPHGPDGVLREYAFARDIARRVSEALEAKGVKTKILVTEEKDISLNERVRRANLIARTRRCILVSIHNDALGNGQTWGNARGCSFRVAPNRSKSSERLAKAYLDTAVSMGLMGNRCIPKEGYWVQNLAICRDTTCPAVLTENLFMDNLHDYAYLMSEDGKQAITRMHVEAILRYIDQ